MQRDPLVIAAALMAGLAIVTGAFGAHGVQGLAAEWLKTAAQYQLAHAIAALLLAQTTRWRSKAWLMLAGALVFAVTLDVMAAGGPRWLGAITPLGGLAMIGAWLWLAVEESRNVRQRD